MMLQHFIEKHTGQVVSHDRVPSNAGQSVQLIAEWCCFIGLPYQWANAFDWWDDSDETFAEHWDKFHRADAGNSGPRPGDIVVFSNLLPGADGCGHLSIFVESVSGSEWRGFDANWGGKSAHIQSHNWSYVVGWFSPVNRGVLEDEIPTPIAMETASDPYEVEVTEARIVVITSERAPLYNLNDVSWDSFKTNIIREANVGDEVTVLATARHRLGGTFYMPDPDRPEGYSIEDCRPYDSEEPTGSVEELAAKLDPPTEKHAGAFAPVLAPSTTDFYWVIGEKVPRYRKFSDAVRRQNADGTFPSGKYYVFKRLENVIHLTRELGQPSGLWLNPVDSAVPEPADWRKTYQAFDQPRYFVAKEEIQFKDLEGIHQDQRLLHRQPVLIAGMVKGPDGNTYALPDEAVNREEPIYYGIPHHVLDREIVRRTAQVAEEPPMPVRLPFHVKMYLLLQNSQVLKSLRLRNK